jgi:hypothetical protein
VCDASNPGLWSKRRRRGSRPSSTASPPRGGVADAIRYALTRWNALSRFLDGGAARWATVASLLATAKLNDVEPFAYLKDVLERILTDIR